MNEAMNTQSNGPGINILKSRDDPQRVSLEVADGGKFKLCADNQCSWAKTDEAFGSEKLRQRIEPWLTALFQSEHLSLLTGSGLTHAVHWIAKGSTLLGMAQASFRAFKPQIDAAVNLSAASANREAANIEDQIRVVNELLLGLSHYCPPSASFRGSGKLKKEIEKLNGDISKTLEDFAASILAGEKSIASASDQKRDEAFGYLVNLLMSLASRSGTRDRLHIFTTNYDRLVEAGAEVAGLHLLDRFIGNLSPIFHSSRLNIDMHYNPPGMRGEPRYLEGVARFTKLHGSVDWVYADRDIRRIGLPFGADSVDPYLKAPGLAGAAARNLMIYPNSAKDRETAAYPYVELFRDFAAAACRPNSTLVTYGYGFGDEHINRVIEDMLTIPSTHLVIISYDDPMGRIMKVYEKARPAQTTLMIGNHLGDLKTLADNYLPKPAIDRTTFRMAELLKARFGTRQTEKNDDDDTEE
ncbi:MAG: SIR2 family protein [Bacillota bacterium]